MGIGYKGGGIGKGDGRRPEGDGDFAGGYANLDWKNDPEGDAKREKERRMKRAKGIHFEVTQQHIDATQPNRDAFTAHAPKE